MRKRTVLIVLVGLLQTSLAQKKETVINAWFAGGYVWQNVNTVDLYIQGTIKKIMVGGGTGFFTHKSFYVAPTVLVGYNINTPLSWGDHQLGILATATLWTFKTNGAYETRIAPEIGLSNHGQFAVSYGYNIPVSSHESSFISRNRIIIRILINY